jgi:hypothetical protein
MYSTPDIADLPVTLINKLQFFAVAPPVRAGQYHHTQPQRRVGSGQERW